MKIPKFLEKTVLNSEQVKAAVSAAKVSTKSETEKGAEQTAKTKYNKEVNKAVNEALTAAKKDWAADTVKAIDRKFGKARQYVSTTGNYGQEKFQANRYESGKNYSTLTTLFSNSPGSIQSASRIREAVIGGGYVIKPEDGTKGKKSDLKKLIKFFDMPNPDDTIETLVGVSIENYLGYGNFYWEKVPTKSSSRKKNMDFAALYGLDPTKMTILVDAAKKKKGVLEKIGYLRKTQQNKPITYSLDEIFQARRPHRKADLYGRAVLEDNTASLQLLMRALTFNINILKNGGRPPLQLILPEDSTEADAEAVSAYWEKNYQGPQNAGKTLISFKGAKAEPLGITPQDMAYLELMNFGVREVAGQYGVPLYLIGFPEGSNRAIAAEARRSFYITNIFQLRKLLSQKITNEIIKKGMKIEGWRFDFKSAGLEESEASRRDFMTGWSKALYTFNEARVAMGLLPISAEWANKHYLLGTKNDSLIEVEKAIGRVSDDTKPDGGDPKKPSTPGEHSPKGDDKINDEDKGNK